MLALVLDFQPTQLQLAASFLPSTRFDVSVIHERRQVTQDKRHTMSGWGFWSLLQTLKFCKNPRVQVAGVRVHLWLHLVLSLNYYTSEMSSTKIVLVPTPVSTTTVQQQQQTAAPVESAKKMARKDKEFLWELDSQVKGNIYNNNKCICFYTPQRKWVKRNKVEREKVAVGSHRKFCCFPYHGLVVVYVQGDGKTDRLLVNILRLIGDISLKNKKLH